MYTGDPTNIPADAVYLNLGLVDPTQSLLTDTEVEYYLNKNSNDVIKASIDCARTILFKLSLSIRSRNDMIEIYEEQKFNQWMKALDEFIKANDPASVVKSIGIALTNAQGYAGNVSKSDMLSNDSNLDNVIIEKQTYLNNTNYNPFVF